MRRFMLAALAVALIGGVYLLGSLAAINSLFPTGLIERVQRKIVRLWVGETGDTGRIISTGLIALKIDAVIPVKVSRSGRGGSLARYGDDLILMTHAGQFFTADGQTATPLDVTAPPNGLAELQSYLAAEDFAGATFDPGQFRYLDVVTAATSAGPQMIISFTEYHPADRCHTTTVASAPLPAGSIAGLKLAARDWTIVYRTKPCLPLKDWNHIIAGHMAGGAMGYAGNDTLYMTSGDYHWDVERPPSKRLPAGAAKLAVLPDNDYGKLLRLSLKDRSATIVSRGLRNAKGLAIDGKGQVWTVENGPAGGDELNLGREGANFGWPDVSLGMAYSGQPWSTEHGVARHEGYDQPAFAWTPSVAPSEMLSLQGFHEYWDGDLLFGTMATQALHRIRLDGARVVSDETIVLGERVRALDQAPDGRIVVWTDSAKLLYLSPLPKGRAFAAVEQAIDAASWPALEKEQTRTAIKNCLECHVIEAGQEGNAPNLAAVFDKPVAGTGFALYSDALRQVGGKWTAKRLDAYLADPEAFAPGTSMPVPQLPSAAVRGHVIEMLEQIGKHAGAEKAAY